MLARLTMRLFTGIGFEFVKLLNSKGCHIVIGDLALTPAAEQFLASPDNPQAKILFKKTDVSDWSQLTDLFTFAERELGPPDLVCPGAAIFEPVGFDSICTQLVLS
jgi:3-hydroxybutyrate dehydrogenase